MLEGATMLAQLGQRAKNQRRDDQRSGRVMAPSCESQDNGPLQSTAPADLDRVVKKTSFLRFTEAQTQTTMSTQTQTHP